MKFQNDFSASNFNRGQCDIAVCISGAFSLVIIYVKTLPLSVLIKLIIGVIALLKARGRCKPEEIFTMARCDKGRINRRTL